MMSKYTPCPQEFDDWAGTYDQDVRAGANQFPFDGYSQVLDEVTRQAEARPGGAILDLGVGTGNLAGRFLATGCAVYGLDFSSRMLAAARARYPQLHLAQADLQADWPGVIRESFDRSQFDAIVSGYTFHHFDLPTKLRLLTHLASDHLLPGGRIVIGDVAFASPRSQDAARLAWGDLWEEEDYWIADETLSACQAEGLQTTYQQISSCGGVFTIQSAVHFADKEPT